MKFEATYKRTLNLLINPKAEFDVIKTENKSQQQVMREFGIPMIILLVISSMIGNSIYASRLLFSFPYIIFNGIAMFFIGYVGVLLGGRIINEITPSFNTRKDINITFNLIIYSLSTYCIFMSLAFLLPSPFYQIRYFGLYAIYIFWVGSGIITETPNDNKVGFVFVSNLILFGIFSIFSTICSIILKGAFGLSLVLK